MSHTHTHKYTHIHTRTHTCTHIHKHTHTCLRERIRGDTTDAGRETGGPQFKQALVGPHVH